MSDDRFGQQEIHPNEKGIVTLRGFLYQTPEGVWVLSQEPNLKSCCVGSASKVMNQLYVDGNFPDVPAGQVVSLSGVFKVDPKYTNEGKLTQYYTLSEAAIQQNEYPYSTILWVGIAVILLIAVYRIKPFEIFRS